MVFPGMNITHARRSDFRPSSANADPQGRVILFLEIYNKLIFIFSLSGG